MTKNKFPVNYIGVKTDFNCRPALERIEGIADEETIKRWGYNKDRAYLLCFIETNKNNDGEYYTDRLYSEHELKYLKPVNKLSKEVLDSFIETIEQYTI